MHDFKNIIAWQKSREFVKDIYELTEKFPKAERYEIVSQMRRAAVSIASNIAEGAGRRTQKDFIHFLDMSIASSYELETLIILTYDLKVINETVFNSIIEKLSEVQKLIVGFQKSLKSKHLISNPLKSII